MEREVVIVHFNTPELTGALVRSIHKHTPGCHINVFDNSDRRPFESADGVTVLDNTRGQLIDFEALLARYPDQRPTDYYQASAKHIASVDYMFDLLPEGFVLMDSDVLVKRDISSFWDRSVAWVGSAEKPPEDYKAVRLAPYLLWINVPMLRKNGIRFWHEGMVYKLSHAGKPFHDTGGSMYHDCIAAGLPERRADIYQYIIHLGEGSFRKTEEATKYWLEQHKELYL